MNLSKVSHTALTTLLCRAVESEVKNSKLHDPMAVQFVDKLLSLSSEQEKKWIIKSKKSLAHFPSSGDRAQCIARVNRFDRITSQYISGHEHGTVINLGCGLDTMYWRIQSDKCRYIELDLPEIIELKKELLENQLPYEMLAYSVLDTTWIDNITESGNSTILFLAQGLLYYLPADGVINLFKTISEKVIQSEMVFDSIPHAFTRGFLNSLVKLVFGIPFTFGVKNASEIESFAKGLKVTPVEKSWPFQLITVDIN
jgi:methyltransferase (TIGR00027 family)